MSKTKFPVITGEQPSEYSFQVRKLIMLNKTEIPVRQIYLRTHTETHHTHTHTGTQTHAHNTHSGYSNSILCFKYASKVQQHEALKHASFMLKPLAVGRDCLRLPF